jgi:hypothetical protein
MTSRNDTAGAASESRPSRHARHPGVGRSPKLQNVRLRLDAWRDAERRRDKLASDSIDWQEADGEVHEAAKAFHAEVAQASARYAENEFQYQNAWSFQFERAASRASSRIGADRG